MHKLWKLKLLLMLFIEAAFHAVGTWVYLQTYICSTVLQRGRSISVQDTFGTYHFGT